MKIICKTAFTVAFAFILFAGCNPKQEPEQKVAPVGEATEEETKVEGIKIETASLALSDDPVCKMSVKEHVADTASFEGKLYGFCSTGCKEDFVKEPAKYLK